MELGGLGIPTRTGREEMIENVRPKFVDKYMVVVEPTSMYWPEDEMEHVTQRVNEDGRVGLWEKVCPKFDDMFTFTDELVFVIKPPTVIMYCPV